MGSYLGMVLIALRTLDIAIKFTEGFLGKYPNVVSILNEVSNVVEKAIQILGSAAQKEKAAYKATHGADGTPNDSGDGSQQQQQQQQGQESSPEQQAQQNQQLGACTTQAVPGVPGSGSSVEPPSAQELEAAQAKQSSEVQGQGQQGQDQAKGQDAGQGPDTKGEQPPEDSSKDKEAKKHAKHK